MSEQKLSLSNGYYELPKGKLVNLVTCLEMKAPPQNLKGGLPTECRLERVTENHLEAYRGVFKAVGENIMWFSRLMMPDEKLKAIFTNPAIESFIFKQNEKPVGLLELNFEDVPDCELAFYGLVPDAIGQGLGRALMTEAITRAFQKPIQRLWVHTCHFDHPSALEFYQRSGFKPYKMMIEVHDDPRLQGFLPESASPKVTLLKP